MAFQRNTTSITRSALNTKLGANAADINTLYVITDAVGSTAVIAVQAASVSALRATAVNYTTEEYGVYDISGDTFTAQGGGITYPLNATGAINETSATLASASTVNIGAAAANAISITGTTTITAFDSVQSGAERTLTFAGALILTHNGTSLILPTGANITTAAGDVAVMQSLGSGNWRCVSYQRADGSALFGPPIVVSGSLTAKAGGNYINVASATYTDPTPFEGAAFWVFVVNGTATVGGTGYSTAGTQITRVYHSGSWTNNVVNTALYELLSNKNASGGYAGLSGFKIQFKNALGTFTSLLSNANTAIREYVFPDYPGIVAIADVFNSTLRALGFLGGAGSNTGTDVFAVGSNSASNNSGNNVLAIGNGAASGNGGSDVTAIGNNAAGFNTGSNVIAIGSGAASSNSVSNVIALGTNAGASNGLSNVFIVSNDELPSFADYAAAASAYSLAPSGSTFLFHDQSTNSIGAYRP